MNKLKFKIDDVVKIKNTKMKGKIIKIFDTSDVPYYVEIEEKTKIWFKEKELELI